MKIDAKTIDELFLLSNDLGHELKEFDNFIMKLLPGTKRQLFTGNSITMIGYGETNYYLKSGKGVWPIISVAPQKTGVSLYIAAQKDGMEIAEYYKGKLKNAQFGKKTIRFKHFDLLDKSIVKEMIFSAFEWQKNNKNTYGRNCAKPIES